MNICVIGNSHAGALKAAWDKEAGAWQAQLTFFASPGLNSALLEERDGVYVASKDKIRRFFNVTSGGKEEIDPSHYDAFVIAGVHFSFPLLRPRLSRQVRKAVISDMFDSSDSFSFLEIIRKKSSGPIVISPRPLYPHVNDAATDENSLERFEETIETMNEVGDGLQALFAPPPVEALSICRRFTKPEYLTGADTLNGGKHKDESNIRARNPHGNADYGSLVLREIFKKLGVSKTD